MSQAIRETAIETNPKQSSLRLPESGIGRSESVISIHEVLASLHHPTSLSDWKNAVEEVTAGEGGLLGYIDAMGVGDRTTRDEQAALLLNLLLSSSMNMIRNGELNTYFNHTIGDALGQVSVLYMTNRFKHCADATIVWGQDDLSPLRAAETSHPVAIGIADLDDIELQARSWLALTRGVERMYPDFTQVVGSRVLADVMCEHAVGDTKNRVHTNTALYAYLLDDEGFVGQTEDEKSIALLGMRTYAYRLDTLPTNTETNLLKFGLVVAMQHEYDRLGGIRALYGYIELLALSQRNSLVQNLIHEHIKALHLDSNTMVTWISDFVGDEDEFSDSEWEVSRRAAAVDCLRYIAGADTDSFVGLVSKFVEDKSPVVKALIHSLVRIEYMHNFPNTSEIAKDQLVKFAQYQSDIIARWEVAICAEAMTPDTALEVLRLSLRDENYTIKEDAAYSLLRCVSAWKHGLLDGPRSVDLGTEITELLRNPIFAKLSDVCKRIQKLLDS